MYNPANFSVNYAASSNYSNSSNYANGAGYADSLRVNGSVVDPNSLGIYIATYNRYTYDSRNDYEQAYFYFDCAGFSLINNIKIIIKTTINFNISGRYQFLERLYFNINNTGNVRISGTSVISGIGLYIYSDGMYKLATETITGRNCNCDDSRCGDDGF